MLNKTLGELRATLQQRLGFGSSGAASGINSSTIDNFLYNAQVQLYWACDWKKLTFYTDKTVGVGQVLMDYPTVASGAPADANPDRILRIAVLVNGIYQPVQEGIGPDHYTYVDRRYYPQRYERYSQIELWPQSDGTYSLRIWYIRDLARFSQDNDRTTIDSDLVFMHAIANGKSHYRHPDADVYAVQLDTMMKNLKTKQFGNRKFVRGSNNEIEVRPVVI